MHLKAECPSFDSYSLLRAVGATIRNTEENALKFTNLRSELLMSVVFSTSMNSDGILLSSNQITSTVCARFTIGSYVNGYMLSTVVKSPRRLPRYILFLSCEGT